MIYVLDASAMLAYLHGEAGADVVENALIDTGGQCMAHSVNLCEAYYIVHRDDSAATAEAAINDFRTLGVIERADFDQAFWKEAGGLKAGGGISLPDCFAVTLTKRVGGTLLTSDHGEMDKIAAALPRHVYQVTASAKYGGGMNERAAGRTRRAGAGRAAPDRPAQAAGRADGV